MTKLLLFLIVPLLLIPATVHAQTQDPWAEVFDNSGNIRPDVIDLGVTTEHPGWMTMTLPFGQALNLDANYHRYQTPGGNIVILPSASTLFFMAMNPKQSGLDASIGMVSNGYGSLIAFLGLVAGNNVDWNKVRADHPDFKSPDQFWNAVLNGQQDVWTYFSGWGFITNLLSMSWNDTALRTAYLMYLNGVKNCASIPGGCNGIANLPPPTQARLCPDSSVILPAAVLSILKTAPINPLVIGQDVTNRRGADIVATVTVPPVIFTWYEPTYENRVICRLANPGETPNCKTGAGKSVNDGVLATEVVFKECRKHVEHLPDAVASLQATASIDSTSQAWITGQLGQTHYGAYIHQANYNLIPNYGAWKGACNCGGTCTATGQALGVPFADPGSFDLHLTVTTTGARFRGIPITQPRKLETDGKFQVFVTLPALVP